MEGKNLRIVFFGTPEFATASLHALVEGGYNVVGVVTATDKPGRRGHKLIESDVKKYALSAGLPLLQPEKLRSPEFLAELEHLAADLFIVVAFRMMPECVWRMPRLGTFNLHASLLPRYRGAAPINWAIANGETRTGVTTFFLREEIDTGNIIRSREEEILADDNVGTLYERLMNIGAGEVLATVDAIANGTATTRPQEEGDFPVAPKINTETCRIRWEKPAIEIHNLVRAMSPVPSAWSSYEDEKGTIGEIKILRTTPSEESGVAPGEVVPSGKRLIVGTGSGALEILEVKPAGKRAMKASEFLAGNRPTRFYTEARL